MQNLLDRFFFTKIGVKVQHKGHGKTHWIMVVTWITLRYGYGRLGVMVDVLRHTWQDCVTLREGTVIPCNTEYPYKTRLYWF